MTTQEKLAAVNALIADPSKIVLSDFVRLNNQITEGFEGKVSAFGYVETTMKLTNDQKIGDIVIPKDDFALTLALSFESGETISVSTLMRSFKSKIGAKPCRSYTAEDYANLVGKTLRLDSVAADKSTERNFTVNNPDGTTSKEPRSSKAYVLAIV